MLKDEDRVLVVGAKQAVNEYLELSAYFCQPHRYFRPCTRIAFYSNKAIQPFVPSILGQPIDEVVMSTLGLNKLEDIEDWQRTRLSEIIYRLSEGERPGWAMSNYVAKVVFLSDSTSPETIKLNTPVPHKGKLNSTGRPIPFVQGQCYVSLSSLLKAKTTDDLERETDFNDYHYPTLGK